MLVKKEFKKIHVHQRKKTFIYSIGHLFNLFIQFIQFVALTEFKNEIMRCLNI